jgi:hypothetical protein
MIRGLLMAQGLSSQVATPIAALAEPVEKVVVKTAKRKLSAYNRRYKAAFKQVSPRYKLKNGNWKSNGFRSAVRAAHKMAKK